MGNLYGPWERRRLACPGQGFGGAKPLPYHPKHMDQQSHKGGRGTAAPRHRRPKPLSLDGRGVGERVTGLGSG